MPDANFSRPLLLQKSQRSIRAVLQALARAFLPDVVTVKIPDEIVTALPVFEHGLLLEVGRENLGENEEEGEPLDADWRKSTGYRRLCSAAALLKLARVYDARLQITTFLSLALMMQASLPAFRKQYFVTFDSSSQTFM